MNIYGKLQLARVKLQAMNCKKSGHNKFSGFSYYELSDFLPKVNEIFCELGLYSVFCVTETEARLEIINTEKPEEHVVFTSPTAKVELKGCTPIQAIGAIHTYMKRYLYLNALEIVEHDALDAAVGAEAATVNSTIDYEKSIENIANVTQLNNTYKFFVENIGGTSWKDSLKTKAEHLGAVFNVEAKIFEIKKGINYPLRT